MAAMKAAWSQLGGAVDEAVDDDGVGMYGSARGAPYIWGIGGDDGM